MAAQFNGALAPIVFSFQSTNIRTFADDNGEPWFCAKDVCKILGYANDSKTIKDHCRENGVTKRYLIDNMNREQEVTFINEGNLYRLILRSKKPEAEKFEQLVMEEILPTIRKTGSYHHKPESLPSNQAEQLAKQISKQISKHLQKALPSQDYLLPPHQAKEIVERLNRLCQLFHPFSQQFADAHGVLRALWGCHPKLGMKEESYKVVIEHPESSKK
ncbi:BRO-N domain-containing protein [Nitrosomonas communis]|uniref:BRO-N domain-containing protein n=1 Tax=Nitrosomonas communis TaxID=44574 RepID=UPI003D28413A